MCQLSLVATTQPVLNKVLLYHLLIANSIASNKDGTGWYNPTNKHISKSKDPAETSREKLSLSLQPEESEVLLGHVRNASFINSKRIISDEKAHPFVSENFVLMHNGGLERKINAYLKEELEMIDSELFLKDLEEEYKTEKDFIKCINNTMSKYQGKFAFLIAHGDDIYVIRGKTADLYTSNLFLGGKFIGIVTNTNDITAGKSLNDLINLYTIWGSKVEASKFVELDKESIYKLTNFNLVKVGEIKENDKPIIITGYTTYPSHWVNNGKYFRESADPTIITRLVGYISNLGLTVEEMDKVFEMATTGNGILQCEPTDLEDVWPVLDELAKRLGDNKKAAKQWRDLQNMLSRKHTILYNYLDIQFPYFLPQNNLKKILNDQKEKIDLLGRGE